MSATILFVALLWFHLLADYPLQGDFLSKAKNPVLPLSGVPWSTALMSHAMIHGGFVWLAVTAYLGVMALAAGMGIDGLNFAAHVGMAFGLAEILTHGLIDYAKCVGVFGYGRGAFVFDQMLHFLCKLAWTLMIVWLL